MLFVGDDWAEGHHDIEIVDGDGKLLVRWRLPEGLEGVTRMHALIAAQMPDDWISRDPDEDAASVKIGVEADRGSWVAREPPRRHPPRLPQNPHQLRRARRLATQPGNTA